MGLQREAAKKLTASWLRSPPKTRLPTFAKPNSYLGMSPFPEAYHGEIGFILGDFPRNQKLRASRFHSRSHRLGRIKVILARIYVLFFCNDRNGS